MLQHVPWIDGAALRRFILSCQDDVGGGVSDKPTDEPDIFHTFFGIAGLSLLKSDGVLPIDPAYAMPVRTMERLRSQQQQSQK
jgi:geranylgeranyl transferase type-2 subunit beta